MKIRPEHYEYMRAACATVIAEHPELKSMYTDSGLSDMRFRWDLARRAGLMTWICDNLYSYANDDHIDTALRRIVKEWAVQ